MEFTDPEEEKARGRIALWLDPNDIAFLANEWRKIPENAPESVKEAWARVAYRASTALHKAGVTYSQSFRATMRNTETFNKSIKYVPAYGLHRTSLTGRRLFLR
jgi:hypothetical protein